MKMIKTTPFESQLYFIEMSLRFGNPPEEVGQYQDSSARFQHYLTKRKRFMMKFGNAQIFGSYNLHLIQRNKFFLNPEFLAVLYNQQ